MELQILLFARPERVVAWIPRFHRSTTVPYMDTIS
jgi:hypothetical protein